MSRRAFLQAIAAAVPAYLLAPRPSLAQKPVHGRPYRIALLPEIWDVFRVLFVEAMAELGWKERRDFLLVRPGTPPGPEIEETTRRIVAARPDLIYALNTGYALAAHRLDPRVPIVMVASGYPVEAGLAESLARPGKNVTGNAGYAGVNLHGKVLELLAEIKPGVRRVGVLWSYVPPAHPVAEIEPCYEEMRVASRRLGIAVDIAPIAATSELDPALARFSGSGVDALYVTAGPALWQVARRIDAYAIERHLPTVADWLWDAPLRPLLVYTPEYRELTRQAVSYVDRILRGAKPGDLPIQQPSRFELVVDLAIARAIGLTVPGSLLLRADRIIE